MADISPSAPEDPFHFQLENRRIGIKPAMNAAGLHERM
jgi:hypothetical protein